MRLIFIRVNALISVPKHLCIFFILPVDPIEAELESSRSISNKAHSLPVDLVLDSCGILGGICGIMRMFQLLLQIKNSFGDHGIVEALRFPITDLMSNEEE